MKTEQQKSKTTEHQAPPDNMFCFSAVLMFCFFHSAPLVNNPG